jgi:hypothetical protein
MLFTVVKSPKADFVTNTVLIGFPVSIILLLGPWWPSPDKTQSMLPLRRLLQIVFGLLSAAVIFNMAKSPTADFVADTVMVGLFVFVILVLGPWWPSPDNARKWDWALKLDLPTDDPKIAAPLAGVALGAYSLYLAWSAHTQPNRELQLLEKIVAVFSGREGVAVAWAIISVSCFVGAWRAFKLIQTKPKNAR